MIRDEIQDDESDMMAGSRYYGKRYGHYGYGGVKASMDTSDHGLIDNWLRHIKDVFRIYSDRINALETEAERHDLMCELNILEQVNNVCETTIVQNAWKAGLALSVHGWIYDIRDGLIQDLGLSKTGLQD